MQMLRALLGIKVDPDMLHIVTHARALPLYHGAYSQQLAAIDRRLAVLPGLFLEANYKGGVSVRDRILCADAVARRILHQRQQMLAHRAALQIPEIVPGSVPVSATLR